MEVIGGASALISLIQTCADIAKYIRDVRDGSSERSRLMMEVISTQSILQAILDTLDPSTQQALTVQGGPVTILTSVLSKIHKVFIKAENAKGLKKTATALVWPFKKAEVEEKLGVIERQKLLLTMALTGDHVALSREIQKDTTSIRHGVEEIRKSQLDEHAHGVLNWLTETHYTTQQADFIRRRQKGTGGWLLHSPEYEAWLNKPGRALFCPGIPGSGKTILASIVISDLKTKYMSDATVGIAFVYLNFNRPQEQTVENLLLSLSRQLAAHHSTLPAEVSALHSQHISRREKSRPDKEEALNLLKSLTKGFSRTFIVIDAVDECKDTDGCRMDFISSLLSVRRECDANIMATSRPNVSDVTEAFAAVENDASSNLEILARDDDVLKYLDQRITALSGVKLLQTYREQIKEEIVKVVQGMFLLAQLHFDSIRTKKTWKKMKEALTNLSSGKKAYDDAYEEAMSKRVMTQDPDSVELAVRVLSWIVCANEELNVDELRHALAVEFDEEERVSELDEDNVPLLEDVISVCAGLVTVDEQSRTVRLVHYTTQEYFNRKENREKWLSNAEDMLAVACLAYLSLDTFEGGVWRGVGACVSTLVERPFYNYAVMNWYRHVNCCDVLPEAVFAFLETKGQVEAAAQVFISIRTDYGFVEAGVGGRTGLHLAVFCQVPRVVGAILEQKSVDKNAKDKRGATPLMCAVVYGDFATVRLLLDEEDISVDEEDMFGITALQLAAARGSLDAAGALIEKGLVSGRGDLDAALGWAAACGKGEMMRFLLNKGADANAELRFGNPKREGTCTPLHLLVGEYLGDHEGSTRLLRILLEAGADLNATRTMRTPSLMFYADNKSILDWRMDLEFSGVIVNDTDGDSDDDNNDFGSGDRPMRTNAFLNAVWLENWPLAWALLDFGADINAKNEDGLGALHMATIYMLTTDVSSENIEALIARGANPDGVDRAGFTPLEWCLNDSVRLQEIVLRIDPQRVTRALRLSKIFLDVCPDVSLTQTRSKRTLLHRVMRKWNKHAHIEELARMLFEKGARPDVRDVFGRTPLSYTAEYGGREGGAEMLINTFRADANVRDELHRTPLFYAARQGHNETARLLINVAKADVNLQDQYGATALSIAGRFNCQEMVRLLIDNGADVTLVDKSGKNAIFWAAFAGRTSIVKMLVDEYNKLGVPPEKDVTIVAALEGNIKPGRVVGSSFHVYCSVCMVAFPLPSHPPFDYYRCKKCLFGCFFECLSCFKKGMRCLDDTHGEPALVLKGHVKNWESENDKREPPH